MDLFIGLSILGILFFVIKSLVSKKKKTIKNGRPIEPFDRNSLPLILQKRPKYTPEEYHRIYTEGLREYDQKRESNKKRLSPSIRKHAKPEIDKFLNTKRKTKLVVFDVETNGLEDWRSVLSCSAIKYETDPEKCEMVEIDRFHRYYYPEEEFNPQAIAINGLTKDTISEGRGNAVYPEYFNQDNDFEKFCNGVLRFVAHNISFDMRFIPFLREKKKFCTMMTNMNIVAVEFLDWKNEWKWPKLSETAIYYDIPFDQSDLHGSMFDAEITAEIFKKMLEAVKDEISEDHDLSVCYACGYRPPKSPDKPWYCPTCSVMNE